MGKEISRLWASGGEVIRRREVDRGKAKERPELVICPPDPELLPQHLISRDTADQALAYSPPFAH